MTTSKKKEQVDNKEYNKIKYNEDNDEYEKEIQINWNHYYKEVEHQMKEKYGEDSYIVGSGLDGALEGLNKLSIKEKDMHPEKRMKAGWMAFLEVRMPQMKEEFPSFKRSQLLERISKEWRKSPDNPLNND